MLLRPEKLLLVSAQEHTLEVTSGDVASGRLSGRLSAGSSITNKHRAVESF